MACYVVGLNIGNLSHTPSSFEPAGEELAGRLAALARMFAIPVSDLAWLEAAGLQVEGIAEKDLDDDELAAAHYRVLHHDLVPDAGVFLEQDGMLGGPLARSLTALMTAAGFTPDDATRSSGHIVNELGFLAHVLGRGQHAEAAGFWREHASGWMPLVVLHLHGTGSSWFDALADALEQALGAFRGIDHGVGNAAESPSLPPALPSARLDLDEPHVGLAHIAEYLATPARSGLVLSRTRLAEIGRAYRLPTGFGSRSRIVEGLLRSATQYEGWDAVCEALLAESHRAEVYWMSSGSLWAARWKERLLLTRATLTRLRDARGDLTASE